MSESTQFPPPMQGGPMGMPVGVPVGMPGAPVGGLPPPVGGPMGAPMGGQMGGPGGEGMILTEEESSGFNVLEYVYMLRRRWLIILLTFLLIVAAGFFYTIRQPKVYQASASIILNQRSPKPLNRELEDVGEMQGYFYAALEFRATQMRVISSSAVMEKVVKRLGLDRDDEFLGLSELPPAEAEKLRPTRDPVSRLVANVTAQSVPESMIVKINVKDGNADRAARIANAVVEAYVDHTMSGRFNINQEASAWLNDKVVEIRTSLDDSEERLYEFERSNNIVAISYDDQLEILSARLKKLAEDLYTVRNTEVEYASRLKMLESASGEAADSESLPFLLENETIYALLQQKDQLQTLFNATAVTYGPKHPEYQAIESKMLVIRELLDKRITAAIEQYRLKMSEVRQKRISLEDDMAKTQSEITEMNRLTAQYNRLNFDVDNYRKIYSLLLRRSKEAQLTERVNFSNVQLLEMASKPGAPISPNPPQNLAIAIVLGLFAGIGMAFIGEFLDRKIKGVEDAEQLTGSSNLGTIMHIQADDNPSKDLAEVWEVVKTKNPRVSLSVFPYFFPRSQVAESSRVIRTNLLLMDPDSKQHLFMVTSAFPQEGKSTTTSILGTIMASLGQRVLLIDADLRRPHLHQLMIDENGKGISNWITGDATTEEIVHPTFVPGLDIIPCGPPPPNPTEILHSERMRDLLAFATENYSVVILDTPPLGMVSDALVMAALVRRVMLVIDPQKSDRHVIRSVARQIRNIGVPILGFVFNNIAADGKRYGTYRTRYYRYYRYYSPYSYGNYYYTGGYQNTGQGVPRGEEPTEKS